MSKVTVYRFRLYDPKAEEMVQSSRWGTRSAIESYERSLVLDGTAVEIDAGCVKSDLPGFTVIGFDPARRLCDGFQSMSEMRDFHAIAAGALY